MQENRPRIAVVGGGISGLAAAHRLVEKAPAVEVVLLEGSHRLGGVLETVHRDGFVLERSADNFITSLPWGIDLCRRLGLETQLLQTNSNHRQAFVVRKGRLHKIPDGFLIMAPKRIWPVMSTPILSLRGKMRLACEYFVPARKQPEDESLASFAQRRLGREVYERLVQPLVGGIYTADPRELSVQATMPRFREMEEQHGGLIRAAWRQARNADADRGNSGARYSMFVAPRDGVSSLVAAIADRLPPHSIHLNSPVEQIEPRQSRWAVRRKGQEELLADAVVVALPAHQATTVLEAADSKLAELLGTIEHTPCAIVCLGYQRQQIRHALDGFGFVVPLIENRKILSASFSSVKYPGRAPQGCELIRAFVGGACQSELVDLPDDVLLSLVAEELAELIAVKGEPLFQHIVRWPPVMPKYRVGHCQLVDQIEQRCAALPGLEIAGNAYEGVGIPNCIHRGEQVADRILNSLLEN